MKIVGCSSSTVAALIVAGLVPFFPHGAQAATRYVGNCNDSGAGSLRSALAAVVAGDTVDLTQLRCGRITLNGWLEVPGGEVTIMGPGKDRLIIDAAGNSGVFWKWSSRGTLRLRSMTLTNGFADGGGCVYAQGDVELHRMRVHHCQARGPGGGVWSMGSVLLAHSSVVANVARGEPEEPEFDGTGGGINALRGLVIYRSRVAGNRSGRFAGGANAGGKLVVMYSSINGNTSAAVGGLAGESGVLIDRSTIAGNRAQSIGGLYAASGDSRILNSTISANRAQSAMGVMLWGSNATIANSTIAFNYSTPPLEDNPDAGCGAAVEAVAVDAQPLDLHVTSSIIAMTRCFKAGAIDLNGIAVDGVSLVGSDNIIGRSTLPVPPDTLCADPRLGPLAFNGGPTKTHALLWYSPAINRGNNVFRRTYDQRGPGFPRVKGVRADIGAYER